MNNNIEELMEWINSQVRKISRIPMNELSGMSYFEDLEKRLNTTPTKPEFEISEKEFSV